MTLTMTVNYRDCTPSKKKKVSCFLFLSRHNSSQNEINATNNKNGVTYYSCGHTVWNVWIVEAGPIVNRRFHLHMVFRWHKHLQAIFSASLARHIHVFAFSIIICVGHIGYQRTAANSGWKVSSQHTRPRFQASRFSSLDWRQISN